MSPKFVTPKALLLLVVGALCLFSPRLAPSQEKSSYKANKPVELLAVDPEIRALLADSSSSCGQFRVSDVVAKIEQAVRIADSRGLIGDRALAETVLASAQIRQAETELAFSTFQKALEDAIDAKNKVLEADILISLASEAQLKANLPKAVERVSKALTIAEESGSLYEKARALGELGRLKLLLGKTDEAGQSLDEALKIDNLNGYNFQALHLLYRGYYLGVTQKIDQALDSVAQAKAKALAIEDPYNFIMAENAYAFGLVQKGRADEAISELRLLKEGSLQSFTLDPKEQACLASALQLPILHLSFLEGVTNVLRAANQSEKELDLWKEIYSFSHDHGVIVGEAEAAQKSADLENKLKKTDDALKHYAIAAELYRKLENEPLLAQAQVSQSSLLIQVGRSNEALPLEQEIASYARRHNLRSLEFTAYGVLAEIYQPNGEFERARGALENALALIRPGPFDDELDNRYVLEDCLRLADVYRALKIPTKELVAIDKAFFVAVHLKDEKTQHDLVNYLDQRLKDLDIRELVKERQKEGQLAESLVYSCILFIRDGMAKPGEDNSNWDRIEALPFQLAQTADGARALDEVLNLVDSFLGFPKIAMLDALSRYYLGPGNDPYVAEKYALRSEEVLNTSTSDVTALKVESTCALALAYSREFKNSLRIPGEGGHDSEIIPVSIPKLIRSRFRGESGR